MSVICTTSEKGGSGKSTVVTNLAVYLASEGKRVLIFDLDGQQSIHAWMRVRQMHDPEEVIQGVEVLGLDEVIEAGGQDKFSALVERAREQWDYVLLDVPGSDNTWQRHALLVSDIAIMPIVADGFDHLTASRSFDFIEEAQTYREKTKGYSPLKAYLMFNRDYARSISVRMARETYENYLAKVDILETTFHTRVDYSASSSQGMSVLEWNKTGHAAREVRRFGKHFARP